MLTGSATVRASLPPAHAAPSRPGLSLITRDRTGPADPADTDHPAGTALARSSLRPGHPARTGRVTAPAPAGPRRRGGEPVLTRRDAPSLLTSRLSGGPDEAIAGQQRACLLDIPQDG